MNFNRRHGNMLPAVLSIFFAAATKASAIIPFTAENAVALSSVSVQAVLPISGTYRMYVTSNSFTVLSATSTDQATWNFQSGVRLSTGVSNIDSSSITACAILPSTTAASGFRMFYVGISSAGFYSILSAVSLDGLAWTKESGTRLQVNTGRGFLDSPRPITLSNSAMRLFYVADNAGGNTSANYRIFSASSTDGGLTLNAEGAVLSDQAFQVSVTTLTDGRTRLYYSAPLNGQTTGSVVLSAIASNGLAFSKEANVRFSTNSSLASLTYPVVVRSTESFRWRMFSTSTPGSTATPFVTSALTLTPVPMTLNPAKVLQSQTTTSFTLTGEIFSPGPSVKFSLSSNSFLATNVAATNDLTITGIFNPFGQSTGTWDVVVTNADLRTGTLPGGLFIDVAPGTLTILDNLFRPLHGGSAKITATVFAPGRLTLKLYTSTGGAIATIFDQPVAAGPTTVAWNGTTSLGHIVASGVYLLHATGPKLNQVSKIVVIK